ncbi:RsmE family RNA methyltransferase [Phaeodactylibacter luteus]|nr:RsmE family RNA methyltransferase [Phaeodactylibacter luteus]
MQLFFTTDIIGQRAALPADEARHCVQVLRKKPGDRVQFIDGEGGMFTGRILEVGKKSCVIAVEEEERNYQPLPAAVHLAVAPTKNISRIEWLLEKATEIGLTAFHPFFSEHSERKVLKPERLEKIALSAAKQSGRAYVPKIMPAVPFADFLEQAPVCEQRFAAYLGEGVKGSLKLNYRPGADVCLLIGPEGGFSPREAALAASKGYALVSLGPNRLRTETAALAACHTVNLINQDFHTRLDDRSL